MNCQTNKQQTKLLDCNSKSINYEFIIKVSQFSEIPSMPYFEKNKYVYFMGNNFF